MKITTLSLALLLLAACGGGSSAPTPEATCKKAGGQWTQLVTHDAQGRTFNDYHCIGG
jgi:outer membrane biogenesis lipoprotein LolB